MKKPIFIIPLNVDIESEFVLNKSYDVDVEEMYIINRQRMDAYIRERELLKVELTKLKLKNKKLEDRLDFLDCLEAVGTDNWDGYSEAKKVMNEVEND
jgi:hypothetical protein